MGGHQRAARTAARAQAVQIARLGLILPNSSCRPIRRLRSSGLWLAFGRPAAEGSRSLDWETEAVDEVEPGLHRPLAVHAAGRPPSGWRTFAATWKTPIAWWPTTSMPSSAERRLTKWPDWPQSCRWSPLRRWLEDLACRKLARAFMAWRWGWPAMPPTRGQCRLSAKSCSSGPAAIFARDLDGLLAGYLLLEGEPGAGSTSSTAGWCRPVRLWATCCTR